MIYQDLIKKIDSRNILIDESMSKHTSFKVGGIADFFINIYKIEELIYVLELSQKLKFPVFIIGNGTNIIVRDKGIRGVVLKLNFNRIYIEDDKIIADAGASLGALCKFAYDNEIKNFEFLRGIPGTIGGAVKMNAGAYGSEIKDVLVSTTYIDKNLEIKTINNTEHEFGYRKSIFSNNDAYIIQSTFMIEKGNKIEIKQKQDEFFRLRKEKQPLDKPNAGSIFKRGDNYISAKLIDEAGLKGYKIGGAEVSTKHAGFIVNSGNDTSADDIINLIEYVKKVIKERNNIQLETEVLIIGEK